MDKVLFAASNKETNSQRRNTQSWLWMKETDLQKDSEREIKTTTNKGEQRQRPK